MAPPPPELMEELVEEVLLRLPPDDPASLVRASLVCKLWHRLASAASFRRRYREFHRTPPVLGVFTLGQYESDEEEDDPLMSACFCSTSSFRPVRANHYGCRVVDARHGHVLLRCLCSGSDPFLIDLAVWDPITDEQLELPRLPRHGPWNAAVVCAAGGSCDHLDCHRGSFLVIVVLIEIRLQRMFTLIYASDVRAWSEVATTDHRYNNNFFEFAPGVFMGNALYFLAESSVGIVKYDMATREISMMDLISKFIDQNNFLMTMEDGRLGLASINDNSTTKCKLIHLWSMEVGSNRDVARFVLSGVIDLEKLLPVNVLENPFHMC
ncbi:unnamed protein product [Urochloa humidicola]